MFDVEGYLAGSDQRRADEFNEAFADPEVDGVLCVRGGYGCMRTLPLVNFEKVKANTEAAAWVQRYHGIACGDEQGRDR